ncbi:MAG TPA: ABC transporter substrate-binding protein, partial [Herpetosiphonaceae bacterium]
PVTSFSTEAFYLGNMYEQLLRINPPGSAEPYTPLLASSWESSQGGLVWTFKLRPNVVFHDGEPLTAEAVKLSIETAKAKGDASFIWAPLETIEAVDPLTVKMTLKYAAPMELIASSLYAAWIVSPKALKAAEADEKYFEAGLAAGTGPYKLGEVSAGKSVTLTRFDGYWGGWADIRHYDEIRVSIVGDSAEQKRLLDAGEVDLAFQLPLDTIGEYRAKPGFGLVEEPSFFNFVGMFNTLRPPLDNKLVRQALSHAIPYGEIIATGAQGFGTQSRSPVPAGVWPYSENVKQYGYDLDKAKALLKEAGHEGGGFKLTLSYASENQNEEKFAPLIKDSFAKIGVEVTLEPLLFKDQWAKAKADPASAQDLFVIMYWPTYSDAGVDNLAALFHSSEKPSFNLSYWKNAEFDTLIDDAAKLTASDPATALKKYEDAMSLLVDEAPGVFLYDTKAVYAIPSKIKGYRYNLNYPFTQFFYPLHED